MSHDRYVDGHTSPHNICKNREKKKNAQVAIDTLTYKFDVMRSDPADVTEGPDDGIYCHGLWLEGGPKNNKKKAPHIRQFAI